MYFCSKTMQLMTLTTVAMETFYCFLERKNDLYNKQSHRGKLVQVNKIHR